MSKPFEIGKVVNTQGIKGDVRVLPTTDDITRFELLERVELYIKNKIVALDIEKVWYHKNFVILKFKGIDNMTDGEGLKGGIIKIPEEQALPLEEDEYYIRDLYGMEVFTDEGERLGSIKDIIATGANDVYWIKNEDGKEILIPAIKPCILSVSVRENKMLVKLIEGLRD